MLMSSQTNVPQNIAQFEVTDSVITSPPPHYTAEEDQTDSKPAAEANKNYSPIHVQTPKSQTIPTSTSPTNAPGETITTGSNAPKAYLQGSNSNGEVLEKSDMYSVGNGFKILSQLKEFLDQNRDKVREAPIRFKDAVGRKFTFPYHTCATFSVGKLLDALELMLTTLGNGRID